MRLALYVKEFPPNVIGGAETQTRRMAHALQKRGHEVTVYTKSYGDATPDDNEYPFEVVRIPNLRINPFLSTLTFLLASIYVLVRDRREYDFLQCMMIYPNGFVGLLVNRLTGVPYVPWIRGGDYYFAKETPGKRWTIVETLHDGLVLTSTDRVIEDVHDEFPEAELRSINNGVRIPDEPADGDAIVFVGRLKEQKGVDRLLRAAEGLGRSVIVVGDGPNRPNLEALTAKLDLDAEFVGEVRPAEVPAYLRRSDVFVLPSVKGEGGTPNAMLEAMAVGLPVVVTDTGGMLEAIETENIGYMVPPDDVPALRDKLELLVTDKDRCDEMGANARAYVRHSHGFDTIIDQLEAVYEEVTDRSR